MRTALSVNVRRYIGQVGSVFADRKISRARLGVLLLPLVAAMAVTISAQAAGRSKPIIEEFHVQFDGIDQYYISGWVTGCDDLSDLNVTFADSAYGHSTTTNPDGSFGYLLFRSQPFNNTFSARATSNDGVNSPWAVFYFY